MSLDLYFMENPVTGLVKIGVSDCVEKRHLALCCANGVPLLLTVVKGRGDLERNLHRAFEHRRALGEWFYPCDALTGLMAQPQLVDSFLREHRDWIVAGKAARGRPITARYQQERERCARKSASARRGGLASQARRRALRATG